MCPEAYPTNKKFSSSDKDMQRTCLSIFSSLIILSTLYSLHLKKLTVGNEVMDFSSGIRLTKAYCIIAPFLYPKKMKLQ